MKAIGGSLGDENPLTKHFHSDREIRTLRVDASVTKSIIKKTYFCGPFCLCPCFWPYQLCLCIPCSVCAQMGQAQKSADAHKLVLKENSLELTVDAYPLVMRSSAPAMKP